MEYMTQNDCKRKRNEGSEFNMDFKKTFDIVSAQQEIKR